MAEHENEPEFVITRTLDAPREVVFKVWTEADHLKHWWGPTGFTTPFCKVELKPGGYFHYCMQSPDGKKYWGKGTYQSIDAPNKLVVIDTFSNEKGDHVSPKEYGLPNWPEKTQWTVTFDQLQDKTQLTLHLAVHESLAISNGAAQGWNETLDSLATYLKKLKQSHKT